MKGELLRVACVSDAECKSPFQRVWWALGFSWTCSRRNLPMQDRLLTAEGKLF